ncbi:MAG: phosphoribosylamine--glycine ligase [Gemmatimonadaceae bacterium]|nr:phosphoribosylamine--glycine ligase [Gemmatimonadaceae bacterium]
MTVLIVGGGGREHALAWRLKRDEPDLRIIAAPGNPGLAHIADCVAVPADDIAGLLALAEREQVSFTLVGPEGPLALGIVDHFREHGQAIFGPTAAAAQVETSKAFAKELMREAGVPTARAEAHDTAAAAHDAARRMGAPVVIKASGLAAGKGVVVAQTPGEAKAAIDMMFAGGMGAAGETVLVEEFMEGEELSLFVLTDGTRMVPLVPAQDHKRLREHDEGPNTGGMGAYAPVSLGVGGAPILSDSPLVSEVLQRIIAPTLAALRARGTPFTGLLYAGLMLTRDGPKVVEFNCRFGDPETQVVAAVIALEPGLRVLMEHVARGEALPDATCRVNGHAVTTVVAAAGYPERPDVGAPITLPKIDDVGVLVFHAGTTRNDAGELVTSGGRVLAVTACAPTFEDAQALSSRYAGEVRFTGAQHRADIGWREVERRRAAGEVRRPADA